MAKVDTAHVPVSWIDSIRRFLGEEIEAERVRAQVARERASLAQLTERELRDIGVTREDAMREAGRSYYDVPFDRVVE